MMSTERGNETEVKIPLPDLAATSHSLTSLGFTVSVPRGFEANTLYDTADRKLRGGEMLLRLRQFGSKSVITWKGPGIPGPHKSRPELETTIGSVEVLDQILRALDYQPTFRYEKYRTELTDSHAPQTGTVTLDETPIGNFLELEGPGDWIDGTAHRLGFSAQDYVLLSYSRLYLDYCTRHGLEPGHMVFASHS
jgi:adenylate cyclase, class 2